MISGASGMWGDVPLDQACDPTHPSNQYIIQFKENTVQLMETVCQRSNGNPTFNFTDQREEILQEVRVTKEFVDRSLAAGEELPEVVQVAAYLNTLTDDNITKFIDQYGAFFDQRAGASC
uniref:Uncharacterized protein n=1 Tax=Pyramimonas obovata TaxID=1411642 RepID=A0A7S0RGL4_9CHLO